MSKSKISKNLKETPKKYRHLLGKEIRYFDCDGVEGRVYPVAINKRIGLTCYGNWLKDGEDAKPIEFICLDKNKHNEGSYEGMYNEMFEHYIKCFEEGEYRSETCPMSQNYLGNIGTCAFK